jgi:tight adherence protein C
MTSLILAGAFALCVVLFVAGLGMVAWEAPGAERVSESTDRRSRRRPSRIAALQARVARRFAPQALALISSKRREVIRRRIESAGRPGDMTLERYAGDKAASTVTFGTLGVLLAVMVGSPLFVPTLAYFGWVRIDLSLLARAKRRQARIDRELPDFLDILAVTVSAGLGFRTALARVADALGGPLAEEVHTALQQMAYGISRRAAFEGIRDRNESQPLGQFMSALLQAEDLGAPLSDTLGSIASDLRREFAQNARTEAARAVPRVSVITAMVMVPGFVVLMGAALILRTGVNFGALFG